MIDSNSKTLLVKLNGETRQKELMIEEFHPFEPSAYVWDSGWTCYDSDETEYFVSQGTGDVFIQPENDIVGVCPEIVRYMNEMEQRWEAHYIG